MASPNILDTVTNPTFTYTVLGINVRHLAPGENPPSYLTQIAADLLPPWTTARTASLPPGPLSLFEVSQQIYNPIIHGSHWQRLVNAQALSLELLLTLIEDNYYASFLNYPGYNRDQLSASYRVNMPSLNTIVFSASANYSAEVIQNQYNPNGTPKLDPNRVPGIVLQEANTLYDFYYGISVVDTFTAPSSGGAVDPSIYTLSSSVGQNDDGSYQVEWITVNGQIVNGYAITPPTKIQLSSIPAAGSTIEVHYTTYDIYYVLTSDTSSPTVYFRRPYYEVFLTTTGGSPASAPSLLPSTYVTSGVSILTPTPYNSWNEVDEIGLLLGRRRFTGETNIAFEQRLTDSVLYKSNATKTGLRNALATELGLVSHATLSPAITGSLALGNAYLDSILIDNLPLAYYTCTSPSATGRNIAILFPALEAGDIQTATFQLSASGGPVVPGLVPLTYSHNIPTGSLPIYDQITVYRKQKIFSAQSNPWYRGTLQVWKNGIPLIAGVDFTELTSTAFTLTTSASPGDVVQLGYMYDTSTTEVFLEAQADLETDLTSTIALTASYKADPIPANQNLFAGWNGVPPGIDPNAIPAGNTWTTTITASNIGSIAASSFTVICTLPHNINFVSGNLVSSDAITDTHSVSWIDADSIWINNLDDPAMASYLYDDAGLGTPLLSNFANQINAISPLVFGVVKWDKSFWQSSAADLTGLNYIPNAFDPQYQNYLNTERLSITGQLTGGTSPVSLSGTFGTALFGETVFGSIAGYSSPYTFSFDSPGSIVSDSPLVRYPDFQSGIGDEDDLFLSVDESDEWLVNIDPGVFYLNQEERYFYINPVYVEIQNATFFMEGIQAGTPVSALYYDTNNNPVPMRRVYFRDQYGNYTLNFTESISASGNLLITQYSDITNVQLAASSDGQSYTLTSTPGTNQITLDRATTATLDVIYQLNGSFYVTGSQPNGYVLNGGMLFIMEQERPSGVLITYESGTGTNITSTPVHPYYNPRQKGFLYLSDNFILPSTLEIHVDPNSMPADNVSLFTITIDVKDNNGRGVPDLPIQLIVAFREGNRTYALTTDQYGRAYSYLTAAQTPQLTSVFASVSLYDTNAELVQTLSSQTYVEFYASN